jgi:dihydrofolate synthase/folylpolyglutamate synthase
MERLARTLQWLYSLEARGEIYKLERMEHALALIGNPHRRLRAVHIAGTKGKGSVAAMLDACLRAAGYRVGLYTKPHLVNLAERTRVDGAEIPAAELLEYIERLRGLYERDGLALTFFEFTVAMMFLYFAEAQVDIAVIETGLGGRLDSTNVVTPLVSVITPIGFDHVEHLGYTIAAIAAEKGGIIKPEVPVVVGAREPDARITLASIAQQRQSPVRMIDRDFSYAPRPRERRLDYRGLALALDSLDVALKGPVQLENAAVAVAAVETLRGLGWRIGEHDVRRGLAGVVWPGRFDVVSRAPLVILDCAHNALSIAALLETIDVELGASVRPRLVFACLEDKDWDAMAALLGPRIRDATLTRVKPKRPLDPERLVPAFARYAPVRVEREPLRAVEMVIAESRPDDVVLVTGSVYLVGEVYPCFLRREGRDALFPEPRR